MQQKLIDLERDFRVRTHLALDKVLCDELTGEVFRHDRSADGLQDLLQFKPAHSSQLSRNALVSSN
jgi:hypothetical protein